MYFNIGAMNTVFGKPNQKMAIFYLRKKLSSKHIKIFPRGLVFCGDAGNSVGEAEPLSPTLISTHS